MYECLIALCTDICRRYGKTKLLWFADKDKSLAYEPAADEMLITVHRWFANKSCPGDWLYSRLEDVADRVTAELSAQPVSCFVKESAVSHHLKIDRIDLTYNPKADAEDFAPSFKNSYDAKTREPNPEWEEERRQRQEYWAAVKYARNQLYDYYGTGAHFCPAMYTMLGEIKKWSPDQIIAEASRNGLI